MRKAAIEKWLASTVGLTWQTLEPASSDASFRGYWRATDDDKSYIVMDAPPEKEPIEQFVYVGEQLEKMGVHVPHMMATNSKDGFILMEDLGAVAYLDKLSKTTANNLYADALDVLVTMQTDWPATQVLPAYDYELMLREVNLFFDWLVAEHLGLQVEASKLSQLKSACETLIEALLKQPTAFVHRDYHSRNLMVCGTDNPGVIDYQDAVIGPVTYDVVSLLRDCYISWSEPEVEQFKRYYFDKANGVVWSSNVDYECFTRWFDWMGVQRHLKASGIFARLNHRDGKSGYLADIPQTLTYIVDVAKRYPELQCLSEFVASDMLPRLK